MLRGIFSVKMRDRIVGSIIGRVLGLLRGKVNEELEVEVE